MRADHKRHRPHRIKHQERAAFMPVDLKDLETGEALAIYQGEDGKTWARPAEMFNEADRFIPLKED